MNNVKDPNPKDALGTRKVPYSVVPRTVMAELAVAMLEGSRKYGRHNYRAAPVRATIYFDACHRHLDAFLEGEDIDPESGISHVTKAIATLTVLRDALIQGTCIDDRPPKSPEGWLKELNKMVEGVLDRYPDCVPPYTNESIRDRSE